MSELIRYNLCTITKSQFGNTWKQAALIEDEEGDAVYYVDYKDLQDSNESLKVHFNEVKTLCRELIECVENNWMESHARIILDKIEKANN